jgi:hypothetical protein
MASTSAMAKLRRICTCLPLARAPASGEDSAIGEVEVGGLPFRWSARPEGVEPPTKCLEAMARLTACSPAKTQVRSERQARNYLV